MSSYPGSMSSMSKLERQIAKRLARGTGSARTPTRRFKKKFKSGGRQKGVRNTMTTEVRRAIVAGLAQRGGEDGLVGYVRWLGADRNVGALLLRSVLPLEATVRATVEQVVSLEHLDEDLRKHGLPPSAELFARPVFEVDYKGSAVETEEAEIADSEPEPTVSK
jgi:hypothetical protein